jgi:hypothetical protein
VSFLAAVLTEIYLCNVCSCPEVLRRNGRGGRLLSGFELFFTGRKSLFLAFDTEAAASTFRRAVTRASPPHLTESSAQQLQREWCRGTLSNFRYLLALNLLCGRSFNDLAQYPVMPWVIADYTSPELDLADPACFRDHPTPVGVGPTPPPPRPNRRKRPALNRRKRPALN